MNRHRMKRVNLFKGSHATFECTDCGGKKHSEIRIFGKMNKEQKQELVDNVKRLILG